MTKQQLLDSFADNARAWSTLVAKHLVGQVGEQALNDQANSLNDTRQELMKKAGIVDPSEGN